MNKIKISSIILTTFIIINSLTGCMTKTNTIKLEDNSNSEIDILQQKIDNSSEILMTWPLPGNKNITKYFQDYKDDSHTGIDITLDDINSKKIISSLEGKVKYISSEQDTSSDYGMYLIIDHGGNMTTLYGKCNKILVKEGQHIKKGQVIAQIVSNDNQNKPHLHFEVLIDNVPTDPTKYFDVK